MKLQRSVKTLMEVNNYETKKNIDSWLSGGNGNSK